MNRCCRCDTWKGMGTGRSYCVDCEPIIMAQRQKEADTQFTKLIPSPRHGFMVIDNEPLL